MVKILENGKKSQINKENPLTVKAPPWSFFYRDDMSKSPILTASLLAVISGGAHGALLLADNFTSQDPPPPASGGIYADLNNNLVNRQTGSEANVRWTGGSNSQIGNPGGPEELLLSGSGWARLDLAIDSTLVPDLPLSISYDVRITNVAGGNNNNWLGFRLGSFEGGSGLGAPNGDFGFLYRFNGGVELFNTGAGVNPGGTYGVSATGTSFTFVFSDTAGTGSAFTNNGSKVTVYHLGDLVGTYDLGQLTTEYFHFRAGNATGFVDNLRIETIPEPTALLLGSVGLFGMLRRRR